MADPMDELRAAFIARSMSPPMRRIAPLKDWRPMWVEDTIRGLTPGFQDGYDYQNALRSGVKREPGANGHMPSRVPQTGLILKSEQHPTFGLTRKGEEAAGYELYRGKDGRLYSRPKRKGQKAK